MHLRRPRHMPTKFITYFDLFDALKEEGCPICRLLIKRTESYLDSLLYENVNDPGTRDVLRKSHGFCNWHAWRATAISNSELGLAIIYEDLLREQIEHFEGLAAHLKPRSIWVRLWARLSRRARAAQALPILAWRRTKTRCPECGIYSPFAEATLIGTVLDFIADIEFALAFENSFGLCLPHLYAALQLGRDHPHLPRLIDLQARLFKVLRWEMKDLIRKHDYRYADEARGAEAGSWRRAVELFVGKPQVFGNERPSWLAVTPPPMGTPPTGETAAASQPVESDQEKLQAELERLRFENARLERRIKEISREWAEESGRRASLHYQVHKLSEDQKILELNLAGARGESRGWEELVAKLREEIDDLRSRLREAGIDLPGKAETSAALETKEVEKRP